MSEKRPGDQKPEAADERLKRPDEEIKDLDAPPEESENVQGGIKWQGEIK